jgi:hypothetical protein
MVLLMKQVLWHEKETTLTSNYRGFEGSYCRSIQLHRAMKER